jgi:hypothetical protein
MHASSLLFYRLGVMYTYVFHRTHLSLWLPLIHAHAKQMPHHKAVSTRPQRPAPPKGEHVLASTPALRDGVRPPALLEAPHVRRVDANVLLARCECPEAENVRTVEHSRKPCTRHEREQRGARVCGLGECRVLELRAVQACGELEDIDRTQGVGSIQRAQGEREREREREVKPEPERAAQGGRDRDAAVRVAEEKELALVSRQRGRRWLRHGVR